MISKSTRRMGLVGGAVLLVGLGVGAFVTNASATANTAGAITVPAGFTVSTFATGGSLSDPDDITPLGDDIYVAYQNGVGSQGEPSPTGQTASTVVEYSGKGAKVASWNLTGKADGLTADPAAGGLVATVNEDGNSSLYTITPSASSGSQVKHYQYSPSKLPHGGGTDSIAVYHGSLYISASNPSPNADGTTFSGPSLYKVTLSGSTATATAAFKDNSTATSVTNNKAVTLDLSDPDSSEIIPTGAPSFGGDLLLDSQGDGELIFLTNPGGAGQIAKLLSLNTQVDDTAVAASSSGTLYLTDTSANKIYAVHGPFASGSAFVAVPNDSKPLAGTLGQLDLRTGTVTPFGTGFNSPHGLLFVPNS
ncbi:MAG TPA: hypothetical protein VG317_18345 [Pseudonocardiaceae bacterium]|nr:hypothetical protein [Pseudonocardiaceae bacterium]